MPFGLSWSATTQSCTRRRDEHRGRIVKNEGDGFFVAFQSALDAVIERRRDPAPSGGRGMGIAAERDGEDRGPHR